MNISPWEIYWVLQLDSIINVAQGTLFVSMIACVLLAIFSPLIRLDFDIPKGSVKKAIAIAALVAFPSAMIVTFAPSSKTAAAMIVIPAIANNQSFQRESGELYALAKDALREAVKPGGDKK